jgi:ADP-heptose:LPS heptosyltransferase
MNDLRNWKNINQQLVDRGKEITIFINQKDMDWTEELQKLNNGKRGAPYEYPNTLIFAGIAIKCLQHKGYRQLQGFIEDLSKFLNFDLFIGHSSYSRLCTKRTACTFIPKSAQNSNFIR